MTTKARGVTLPSYTFTLIDEATAQIRVYPSSAKTENNAGFLGVASVGVAPIYLGAISASPVAFTVYGQNASSTVNSQGGHVVLQPGTGSGGNAAGNVQVRSLFNSGLYNGAHIELGIYHLWVDSSGRLRIKNSAPTSDTDGTVVGTQT
jgi:hypothetical protein